jgi:hypothetical protein
VNATEATLIELMIMISYDFTCGTSSNHNQS